MLWYEPADDPDYDKDGERTAEESPVAVHLTGTGTLPFLAFAAGQFALHGFPQECRDRLAFVQYGIDPVPRPFRESRRDLFARFVDSLPAHAGDN
jgi:hypothetical protein